MEKGIQILGGGKFSYLIYLHRMMNCVLEKPLIEDCHPGEIKRRIHPWVNLSL